ncbi:hypothetical protein D9619_011689 [Psilocybe cf. subviscida]|uniref:Caprin-1 dimerization domain-containing protein n=1 Tax=Psilocybe cf. subviscida TaxID=2480587 RepID=A0A8H5BUY5_9AGAR|nr:hypothetical protein D9619_011689 [Psilocybe cf. subviscida]
MSEPTTQRIVPGAPPPAPLSKSQKKKRKTKAKGDNEETTPTPTVADATSAALIETAPEPSEVEEGVLAPELIARTDSQGVTIPEEDVLLKPSPIVDLVHKRLKATSKKISRITVYASTDVEKLNDDQRRTLKTLPTLEAVQKELQEVKKAIEVHESELVQEITIKRLEAEKAEKARIGGAVSAAQAAFVTKANGLVDLLRVRSSLAAGVLDISSLADASESNAIFSAADALLGHDQERKEAALNCILFGKEIDGVSSERLLEIAQHAFNPPRVPTPPLQEEDAPEEQPATIENSIVEIETPVAGVPPSTSGGFRFMQASEIETTSFEEGAEWIEKSDAAGHEGVANGHAAEEAAPTEEANGNGPIDWAADDEGGLPSIAGLQAEFGTSGSVTPAEPAAAPAAAPQAAAHAPAVNGGAAPAAAEDATAVEDDGFTQTQRRGRGRGGHHRGGERGHGPRGGFRGGEGRGRGGFHGGEGRGGFHGGEGRGGFRGEGRGGFRGGEGRGGFRGGEGRGGHRGGEGRGGFRGGDRGGRGGEWRGGRGRGGPPGGAPASPAPAA